MLESHPNSVKSYLDLGKQQPDLPFGPLLRCLSKGDDYISAKAAKIIAVLLCSSKQVPNHDFSTLLDWISSQINNQRNAGLADISAQLLASLLRVRGLRLPFYNTSRGMSTLVDALKRNQNNPQMQYQIILCLWLLSYETEIAETMDHKYGILETLIKITRKAVKEKVIRVCVATFRNLAEKALKFNISAMLVYRLLPLCEQLAGRKFQDEDILEDVQALCEILRVEFQNISSYEAYVTELENHRLDWTPVHLSEKFWEENAHRFNDNNYALLKALASQLTPTANHTVLAVVVHDIGQYIKYCPLGKHVLTEIGAKHRIIELMEHEDPDVRYHALSAVQRMMVHAWD
jgi:V-type H+-transporting ATPase subunit H